MTKLVYSFAEGDRDMKDLLGGKGANLCEMTRLGLPVPPGFVITTQACRAYLDTGQIPTSLDPEIDRYLADLEVATGRRLGDPDDPLLVSVRSGAKFSMPGMMDTVLNVGLNDRSVLGLAARSGNDRFAWDSYRRLIQMFGETVLGVEGFAAALDQLKRDEGVRADTDLDAAALQRLVATYELLVSEQTGASFPQDPRDQLDLAVRAVFDSWNGDRARLYRRQERIPADLGTAVSVCTMVFGNLGADSGSGVAFTRDPASGASGVYGDYLQDAQGEDVVAGIRNAAPLADLEQVDPVSYAGLMQVMSTLEGHFRDLCDIEFTIERGRLWMLQVRVGKRTAGAAFRIATQLVDEGLIGIAEALQRVTGAQLARLMFPAFDDTDPSSGGRSVFGRGIGASPGAAVGKVVFDSVTAQSWAARGERVVLVRRETTPDDLAGMLCAEGVLTSHGGKTSHAAVVARGMGKTCVCGAEDLDIDTEARTVTASDGTVVAEGDVLSLDGTSGEVFLGAVPVRPSPVVRYFDGELPPADGDDLVRAVDRLMGAADSARELGVLANADTADDAARARRYGAQGIGLCRTEHMFLGERRQLVEDLVLADSPTRRDTALAALLPLQREDFTAILRVMDGLPVTVRLLDPPLHEFLPDLTELSVEVAVADATGEPVSTRRRELLEAVRRLHETNPMIGLRGVRLGLVVPGLFAMQVRALALAARALRQEGLDPRPEVMVPLVGSVQELELVREEALGVLAEVGVDAPIGTMIELPRAALTAKAISAAADFFSFGTNDLTQTAWGFSRDDVEGSFFSRYLDLGVFGVSPFETIDREGVGRLVRLCVDEARALKPELMMGVCGEHGGDPDSVHFFHDVGLDYVSCSPFRVPVARLEAGRAASARPRDPSPAPDSPRPAETTSQ